MSAVATARRSLPDVDAYAGWWALALLAFVVGDTLTTAVGLSMGLPEAHPAMARVIGAAGLAGVVGVKLAVVAGGAALAAAVPRDWRVGVPVGLALVGVVVTAWNGVVLGVALA